MRLLRSKMLKHSLSPTLLRFHAARTYSNTVKTIKSERFSSKQVRNLFLKYFINERDHTYIHSSPVFLNNDPSLLFVNAGMNQFRSVLLNKTYSGHPFHGLKRATNSQKCVRLSGKHNDLKDVGVDLYHHTFFEMLGNWSFGDYSKMEACKMAWDLLTRVYGLDSQNIYVTYFGGDAHLGILPDEECKRIWLEIGVPMDHIFPFGAKDNFWEMGDTGPCGPCTEIHYDFKSSGPDFVAKKINGGSPDVMEIWNLVFIQYTREKGNILKNISTLHVDTGMGFERLCAVLQGTQSNYDTDVFQPIFKAIQENFKVRPYQGQTDAADVDGLDTAYRILADHSRMFSVAIADGLFPDNYDAGFVLRKIIRRAAYTANRMMKTKPGALSSLVPCVAQTLDFFPEVEKHINEIMHVINEEEKVYHQVINKGRKARNKMILENPKTFLDGHQALELHVVHGLETNVVQDLASEINLTVDWEGYEKAKMEKQHALMKQQEEKSNVVLNMTKCLEQEGIPLTDDSFKHSYSTDKNSFGVMNVSSKVLCILKDGIVSTAKEGTRCVLVTDKTNFYSEAGGQLSDIGKIYNKDFVFNVEHVSSSCGYVFHHGVVTKGVVKYPCEALMNVDKDHRLSCSQNHTATHILNTALRKMLPYTAQRSSFVGPTHLRFGFSAKSHLTLDQMKEIENYVNAVIQKSMQVTRQELMFEELINHPNAILLRGEEYPETVSVISIGNNNGNEAASIEPCCGTHVHNTADIESVVIIPSKAQGGSTKIISAVSGKNASLTKENDIVLRKRVFDLKRVVVEAVNEFNTSIETYQGLLKQVKQILRECQLKYDVPLLQLKKYEEVLKDLKLQLTDVINSASSMELNLETSTTFSKEPKISQKVMDCIKNKNILLTDDTFKYEYRNKEVNPISSKVLAIVRDDELVNNVKRGLRCQIILDKSNFYAEDDDQTGDAGILSSENFVMKVNNVYQEEGYVFHDGYIEEGNAVTNCIVNSLVNQEHRLACSQNHTALHLLISALKVEFPYVFPQFALAGAKELRLIFNAKGTITDDHLKNIEQSVNSCIHANLNVTREAVPIQSLTDILPYKSSLIKKCKEQIPVVSIGTTDTNCLLKSSEPCMGTHVSTTSDIGSFVIISQKSNSKTRERILRAVTGKEAQVIKANGDSYNNELILLEEYVETCLKKTKVDYLELWDCLKEVKEAKVFRENELPLLLFREHQNILSQLTNRLTEATSDFVQMGFQKVKAEMPIVSKEFACQKFIVHMLSSVGDGKKIINYAIDNSDNKPCLYFVKDGHNSIICSCSVPKSLVSPTFNALLWINPVAALLEGKTRKVTKDPELFYSVVSKKTDKVEEAIRIATDIINSHLGSN